MTGEIPLVVRVSLLVTAACAVAWIAWGIREYRRTGRGMWLWMGLLLVPTVVVVLAQYLS